MSARSLPAIRRFASDPRLLRWLPFLVAFVLYLPNFDDFYVSDDFDHPYLDGYSWDRLLAHLLRPSGPGDFFRPLARLSMGLDHLLWGHTPELSHLVNVLLHGASAVLVASLASRLTARDGEPKTGATVGALAGVLFAAHPVHPEAVSFLGGRFDLLCTLFGVASIVAYVRFAEGADKRWLGASTALLLASLLSKEAGLFVPLVLLAYELLCARPRRWIRLAPSFATVALYAAHRALVIGAVGGYADAAGASRHLTSLDAAFFSELIRFSGYGLITPVNHRVFEGAATPLACALLAVFVVLVVIAARRREHARPMLFALCLAGLALVPAAPLFNAEGLIDRLEGARFLYFPSVGICVLLATMLEQTPSPLRALAIASELALYAVLTVAHALPWSHASDLTRASVQTIQRRCADLPGPDPIVLISGAPDNFRGAHVWRNGLPSAIAQLHPQHPRAAFMRASLDLDFYAPEGFDLRDYAGDEGACLLVWDPTRERLVDRSAALRAAREAARTIELPRGSGDRWWQGWALLNARPVGEDDRAWVFDADGDDPYFVLPAAPIDVSEIVIDVAIEPRGPAPSALGELFWAVDDVPFDEGSHHRMFSVIPDGRVHEIRLAAPLTQPAELQARTIRIRVDPTTFPARVTVRRVRLVRHGRWPNRSGDIPR